MPTTIGSGVGASFGSAIETTWGTWLTPTKWLEFDSETIKWNPSRINGKGLYNGGMVARSSQRQTTSSTVAGDVKTPFYQKGMGQFIAALMGTATLVPTQIATSGVYTQAHILGNTYNSQQSLQIGRPDMAGLIHQYNYRGMKLIAATFECAQDGFLECTFTYDGMGVDQTGAYATPTYLTANPVFAFEMATFKMGAFGAEALIEGVRKWTLAITRPHRVDNFYMDGTGLKQQQILNGFTNIALTIDTDYLTDSAFVAQFTADTVQSMVMIFDGGLSVGTTGTNHALVTFAVPALRWEDAPPNVSGPDIIQPAMKLVGLYDDTHAPATITLQSTDATL